MTISIKPSKTVSRELTLLCDACRTETVHVVVAAIDYRATMRDDFRHWGTAQITKCQGCEEIAFRQVCYSQEHPDEGDELLFPPRKRHKLADHLYLWNDIWGMPDAIRRIYLETASAIQHDIPTLAGIGMRTIIEAVCRHQKVTGGDLFKKIDSLVAKGMLTASGAKILHSIRLLGNDAAHEIKAPTEKQAIAAMKVIDHLLLGVYVLPKAASALPRQKPRSAARRVPQGTKAAAAGQAFASASSKTTSGVTT